MTINLNGWLLLDFERIMEAATNLDVCPLDLFFRMQNAFGEGAVPIYIRHRETSHVDERIRLFRLQPAENVEGIKAIVQETGTFSILKNRASSGTFLELV